MLLFCLVLWHQIQYFSKPLSICLCLVGYCQSYVYTSSPHPHRPQRMRQGVGKLSSVMATESSFPFLTLLLSEKLLGFWGIRPITLLVLFLDQGPRLILSHQKYCCEAVVPPDRLPLFGIWWDLAQKGAPSRSLSTAGSAESMALVWGQRHRSETGHGHRPACSEPRCVT